MARFSNRVLEVLDRIYGFVGAESQISRATLEAPIQTVHDLSREAELGSAYGIAGGYSVYNWTQTAAGAGDIRHVFDPYPYALTSNFDPVYQPKKADVDLWLIAYTCVVANTAFTYCTAGLNINGSVPPQISETIFPFFIGGARSPEWTNYAGGGDIGVVPMLDSSSTNYPATFIKLPFRIPHQECGIGMKYEATAAGQADHQFLFWVGRRGTTPPGMR